ncbi:MAG: aldose 1-epimerase family protein [Bythopirellula sp.]
MHSQSWTLTDGADGIHQTDFSVSAADTPGGRGSWSVKTRRFHGGRSDGVDLVEIDNGRMRLLVVPTRGMGIWKAELGDETLGWRSPVRGPVHPKFVPLFDPSGLGWLDGFDELLVRCGLESNGAPEFNEQGQLVYPLHGRIANLPAHRVELAVDEEAETITLRGVVEETRFHFQKLRLVASVSTRFDATSFTINDSVENFGGTPAEMQMLYHINFGEPTLNPGDRLVAPVRSVRHRIHDGPGSTDGWDVYGPPVAGQVEDCFYLDLQADEAGKAQVLLKSAAGTSGTAVSYNTKALPCFTLWKNQVASEDGYVTGLEPATNFPNTRSVEKQHGRVVSLAAGERWSAEVTVDRLTSAKEVEVVEESIRKLI